MSNLSKQYSDDIRSLIDSYVQKYSKFNRMFRELYPATLEDLNIEEKINACQLMISENKSLTEDALSSNQYYSCVIPALQEFMSNPTSEDLKNIYIDECKSCVMEFTECELKCLIDERMQEYCDNFGRAA